LPYVVFWDFFRLTLAGTQFLKDEGAVPSPEDDKKREKVIQELKKVTARLVKDSTLL
jgi:poly(A) polymerase Pap1